MDKTRFIVRTRHEGQTLTDFLITIDGEPGLEQVDLIGPAGKPHTAVVTIAAQQAPLFEKRFRDSPQLMIERDRPLSLLDKTADFLHRSERKNE